MRLVLPTRRVLLLASHADPTQVIAARCGNSLQDNLMLAVFPTTAQTGMETAGIIALLVRQTCQILFCFVFFS